MEEYVNVQIKLRKDTYEDIQNFIVYKNVLNLTDDSSDNLPTDNDINDFVSGCVNHYMRQFQGFIELSGYKDLGKPFRLKNRFKEKLKELGWKQNGLCEKTHIDPANISTILANKNQPSLDYFLRIWVAFGCPPIHEVLYRDDN